jgi:N utilization substance protein A
MGRASGILPYEEQIPGERYRQGERIRAYFYRVEETPRGIFLRLSRSHPKFLIKLFETEAPELEMARLKPKRCSRSRFTQQNRRSLK